LTSVHYTDLPDAATLGGAYEGRGASPVGLQNCVICCCGDRLAAGVAA